MNQLRKSLQEAGYSQFYLFFGDGNTRCRDWVLAAAALRGRLHVLVSLFLLGESVPLATASRAVGEDSAHRLLEANILNVANGAVNAGGFRLLVWRGAYYFCQLSGGAYAYFGEDSLALAQFQTPVRDQQVLDLCSGPGIQAICSAQRGNTVTAVEQNEDACRVLRVNLALNGLDRRVTVFNERLEKFLPKTADTWDQILCNPPLVPMPGPLQELTVWHGGKDGLTIIQRILEAYRVRLRRGGGIEFIGMSLLGSKGLDEANPLRVMTRECGFGGRIHLLSRHAIHKPSVIFEMHAATLAQNKKCGLAAARRTLEVAYSDYEAFFLFYCRLQPVQVGRRPRIELVDMSASHYGGWFA